MKIAVCLSGQLRFFEKSFPLLKVNLIDRYKTDVFLHTWYSSSYENKEFEKSHTEVSQGTYNVGNIEKCLIQYKPISFLIEEPKTFFNFVYGTRENNACSMFYSINACNNLKIMHERLCGSLYDWVIRLRFDWALSNFIDLHLLDQNTIYVPDYNSTSSNIENKHMCDQFAIGSSNNMNVYSETFNTIPNYIVNSKIVRGNENILYSNLEKNNIFRQELNWSHMFSPNNSLGMACPNSLFRE